MRYLGVPLISRKLTDGDCKPLIDKITSRMRSLTSRFPSFAGRLQLIQSVLASITNYWCTMFPLPKKVIKAVERICNSFLWECEVGNALGAKISWESVQPKDEGGLDWV